MQKESEELHNARYNRLTVQSWKIYKRCLTILTIVLRCFESSCNSFPEMNKMRKMLESYRKSIYQFTLLG